MATIVNMHDAKTQLSDLVARAEAGEEIVIARRNIPIVKMVPVQAGIGKRETASTGAVGSGMAEAGTLPVTQPQGVGQTGFAEEARMYTSEIDDLLKAIAAGKEFALTKEGKPFAKVVPVEKKPRVPGALAHLRGNLPDDLFLEPLSEDELQAWEGKYSFDPDR